MAKKQHAKTSPSSSSIWINCPGSVALSSTIDFKDEGSGYSKEGTIAHDVLERVVSSGGERAISEDILEKELEKIYPECTAKEIKEKASDIIYYANKTYNIIRGICRKVGGVEEEFVEQRFRLSKNIFGTADYAAVYRGEDGGVRVIVFDYKYGQGVVVDAEDNTQLACYGLGIVEEFGLLDEVDKLTMFIYQPRSYGHKTLKWWKIGRDKALELRDKLVAASDLAIAIYDGKEKPVFKSGKWCRFCNAMQSGECRVPFNELQENTPVRLLPTNKRKAFMPYIPDTEKLSLEDASRILEYKEAILKMFSNIETRIINELNRDNEVPGWKLVSARRNRTWKYNVARTIDELIDMGFEEELEYKVPAFGKIEKKYGKGIIDELLFKPEPGVKLVQDSERGIEVKGKASKSMDMLDEI